MKARYLIDKSALARMPLAAVRSRLAPIIEAGEAATCAIIDLEVLFSARNYEEHERIRRRRALAYESVPITESILQRAIDVQAELARTGRHRAPIADLIIAAAAEAANLTPGLGSPGLLGRVCYPLQPSNGRSVLGSDPKRSTWPSGSSTFIS